MSGARELAPARARGERPRAHEVDLLRGVAVAMMIVVHTLAFFATARAQTQGPAHAILVVGKAAAVFLVCMGMSAALQDDVRCVDALVRALRLFALGYLLNALKFLPLLLSGRMPDALVLDIGRSPGDPSNLLFFLSLGDILHVAALGLALLATLRAVRARPWLVFAVAACIALASPRVWGTRFPSTLGAYGGELLFSDGYHVFFPAFPWVAYALVGYGLGLLHRARSGSVRALYTRWMPVGLAVAAAGVAIALVAPPAWSGRDAYRTGPAVVLALSGTVAALFLPANILWGRLGPTARRAVTYLSARVTSLYAPSWIVICWSVDAVGFMAIEQPIALAGLVAAVFAATFALDTALRWPVRGARRRALT